MDAVHTRQARKLVIVLFLIGAAFITGVIAVSAVNPIIGSRLGGGAAFAGIPSAVYLAGSAAGAAIWGSLNARLGRRRGLALGTAAGAAGALICMAAINTGRLLLYLAGMLLLGFALAALQLSRFIAGDIHPPAQRGRAIANVILGGAAGAVLGPVLVTPLSQAVARAGMDELAGPLLAAFILLILATILAAAGLKPEPETLAGAVLQQYPDSNPVTGRTARPLKALLRQPPVILALTAMSLSQLVMMSVMMITSLHMKDHHHSLGDISLVLSTHSLGMFAFAAISGRLTDRLGRLPVILAGAGALALSGILASLSPDIVPLAAALFVLGMGWNFCFVGGSSLLADQLAPSERARTQGFNDMLLNGGGMAGTLGAGVLYSVFGFSSVTLAGTVVAAALFATALVYTLRRVAPQEAV